MSPPSSFATICTSNCTFELVGLLLSLSVYHPNEKIYIISDTKTKESIEQMTPKPRLQIIWFIELDIYDGMNREIMVDKGLWNEFQMAKMRVIKKALEYEKDTLLLDCDIIITNAIDDIDITKCIGVSPGFIAQINIDEVGYYNGGMLWTNNINVANDWIEFTKTSRYFDQASIEDLVKKYSYFEFGENYNLQAWRFYLSPEGEDKIASYISSNPTESTIYYKNQPLKFIHTHFLDTRFEMFNDIIITHLKNAKMYKILAIIFRVINNKWILRIPQQPFSGIAFHTNDSYRELATLLKINNHDVDIIYDSKSIHCWIEPNILTYDRPTLEWCNDEIKDASILLLGNGDINIEGEKLSKMYPMLKIIPWIFWARKPIILEQILHTQGILSYTERNIESIFIGNFENSVQEKFRKTDDSWENVITEYYCTKGQQHKFTHEEYLIKLRKSRYGLCLRGYGSKCHREVELIAFGTVPVVTREVTTSSYMEPLIENIHYIKVENSREFKEKISNISEEKWKQMSEACYEWYQRNIHSKNCWSNMIENILYNSNK